MKKKILWVGDACCASGFARATHNILAYLHEKYEVHVLGVNYYGDPNIKPDGTLQYPYPVWPAYPGGDVLGMGRIKALVEAINPTLCIIQSDPWNIPSYLERVIATPVIGAIAVDGKNIQGEQLVGLSHAIFWTEFGKREASNGGYNGPASVIPLGIDLSVYRPYTAEERIIERTRWLETKFHAMGIDDAFVVGVVAKNQPRKRLDLAVRYFAEWCHGKDAILWLHCAPTAGGQNVDLKQLANYYGILDRCISIPNIHPTDGIPESTMRSVYATFDVLLNTSLGEGWWFPGMEAMAVGTPCIAPKWSGYAEWANRAAELVPCSETEVNVGPNTVGGVMDRHGCIAALNLFHQDSVYRKAVGDAGRYRVTEPQFQWRSIADRYAEVIEQVIAQLPSTEPAFA